MYGYVLKCHDCGEIVAIESGNRGGMFHATASCSCTMGFGFSAYPDVAEEQAIIMWRNKKDEDKFGKMPTVWKQG